MSANATRSNAAVEAPDTGSPVSRLRAPSTHAARLRPDAILVGYPRLGDLWALANCPAPFQTANLHFLPVDVAVAVSPHGEPCYFTVALLLGRVPNFPHGEALLYYGAPLDGSTTVMGRPCPLSPDDESRFDSVELFRFLASLGHDEISAAAAIVKYGSPVRGSPLPRASSYFLPGWPYESPAVGTTAAPVPPVVPVDAPISSRLRPSAPSSSRIGPDFQAVVPPLARPPPIVQDDDLPPPPPAARGSSRGRTSLDPYEFVSSNLPKVAALSDALRSDPPLTVCHLAPLVVGLLEHSLHELGLPRMLLWTALFPFCETSTTAAVAGPPSETASDHRRRVH
ncbi:hypothetical protein AB1Y20_003262 [Prymnesium parvum]|uniref:UDENN domain-containing protein n=1 Tax=Prymnesium parvum TaxID=97485 RepID=A0AB34JDC4_PRYPA